MSQSRHAGHLQRLVQFFQSMTAADVPRLRELYASDAFFKDPFNEVHHIDDIERIFARMYADVERPRFIITGTVQQDDQAFITWDFRFHLRRWRSDEQCIRGCSHVRFHEDGRVRFHRDYWDAAEELYEKLPLIGVLMRWMKRRAHA